MANHSGLLVHQLPTRKNGEVRNSSDVKSSRELLIFISVDLQNNRMPCHVGSRTRHLGSSSPTRSTPLCPEIDKHRYLRTLNDLVEQLFVRLHRFIDRRQRSLTCAATPSVRKVLRANTIFLTTLFTNSNRRHRHLLRWNPNQIIHPLDEPPHDSVSPRGTPYARRLYRIENS
jgi:hypothetical protein